MNKMTDNYYRNVKFRTNRGEKPTDYFKEGDCIAILRNYFVFYKVSPDKLTRTYKKKQIDLKQYVQARVIRLHVPEKDRNFHWRYGLLEVEIEFVDAFRFGLPNTFYIEPWNKHLLGHII